MNYIFFDDSSWDNLLPLTYTKPCCELRIGIYTIKEKWEQTINVTFSYITQSYLNKKYKATILEDNLLINGSIIPNNEIIEKINNLKLNQALICNNNIIALRIPGEKAKTFNYLHLNDIQKIETDQSFLKINYPWDIFRNDGIEIENDFTRLIKNKKTSKLSSTNNIIAENNIFCEEGASVEFATLNAKNGPIYIGKNAEIMEGSIIRGPFALCDNATVKMSAKIYGPTTIGPYSKVGGELNNCVIQEYSSKAHDGFLGNAVIGEWCNLGADTNNSNLKNNYADVKIWNYPSKRFINTGLQFCGLIMGDHSKCGINTMFNTGTVVGVYTNIFGSGFPRNFIASFSWGGASGFTEYSINKALEVAEKVMERRGKALEKEEVDILTHIFNITKDFRKY